MRLNLRLLSRPLGILPEFNSVGRILCRWLPPVLVLGLIVVLLIDDISHLNFDEIGGDATQNLYSALNLSNYGTYSEQIPSIDVQPGFRREPVPNFILAAYLKILAAWMPSFVVDGFLDVPELIYAIKAINLFYSAGIMLMIWALNRFLFRPFILSDAISLPLIWCCHRYFIADEIDGLNTELCVSLCLLILTFLFLKSYQTHVLSWIAVAGLGLGLLALTKTVGAYLALMIIPLLSVFLAQRRRDILRVFTALSLGFLLTVSPWLLRNQIIFGKPVIAQGGGDVLLIRSVFNTMTPLEYKGAFYVYSPEVLQSWFASSLYPFSENDLKCGGRLERLNRKPPCDQIALKEKRYADVRSFYQYGKRALPRLLGLSRQERQSEAVRRIASMPLSHVSVSVPLGWRGFWTFTDRGWLSTVINVCAFSSLLIAPMIAIVQRRLVWLIVCIVPAMYFLFHASLTHFLPRYSEPLIPLALITLGMIVVDSISYWLPGRHCYLRR